MRPLFAVQVNIDAQHFSYLQKVHVNWVSYPTLAYLTEPGKMYMIGSTWDHSELWCLLCYQLAGYASFVSKTKIVGVLNSNDGPTASGIQFPNPCSMFTI